MVILSKKLTAKTTLFCVLANAGMAHAGIEKSLRVNVIPDPAISEQLADPTVVSGQEFITQTADKNGFAISYNPYLAEKRTATVDYALLADKNIACKITTSVQPLSFALNPSEPYASVVPTSYSPDNLACVLQNQPGLVSRNWFTLGTALAMTAAPLEVGVILFAAGRIGEIFTKRKESRYGGEKTRLLSENPALYDSNNKAFYSSNNPPRYNVDELIITIRILANKAKDSIHNGNSIKQIMNSKDFSTLKQNGFLAGGVAYYLDKDNKDNSHLTSFKEYFNESNNKAMVKIIDSTFLAFQEFYESSSPQEYKDIIIKTNELLQSKMEFNQKDIKTVLKIGNEHDPIIKAKFNTTQLRKATNIAGGVAFAASLVPIIAYFLVNQGQDLSFDVKISPTPGFRPDSTVEDTFSSQNGGVFYTPEDGISVLTVPTGEQYVALASANPEEAPENPYLYRVEAILPGKATGVSEACASIPTNENASAADVRSVIATGTTKGLSIATFDGNAQLVSHKTLFAGKHVAQVVLGQNTDTNQCGAFVHLEEWIENPDKEGEGFTKDTFLVSETSAPSLSSETTGENDFFLVKQAALDSLGNAFYVREQNGKDTLLTMRGQTKSILAENGIHLPDDAKIASLNPLANGRVLAIDTDGNAYYSTPDGKFNPVLNANIDFSVFQNSEHVSLARENDKRAISLFYPRDASKNASNPAYLGAYVVVGPSAEQEHTFADLKVEKILQDSLVVFFENTPSLLTVTKPEHVNAEGKITKLESYLLAPEELRQHATTDGETGIATTDGLNEQILKNKVIDGAKSSDIQTNHLFYAKEDGSLLRYDMANETLLKVETMLNPAPFSLKPLWHEGSIAVFQGNVLQIKDKNGAPTTLTNAFSQETAHSLAFPTPILDVIAPAAKVGEHQTEVLLVTTEGGGLWILTPTLDAQGLPIQGTYAVKKQLFDGFNFTNAVKWDDKITLSDKDFGTFSSLNFNMDQQSVLDLGEEHFEFVNEESEA